MSTRVSRVLATVLGAVGLGAAGCRGGAPAVEGDAAPRPSIILISVDTLRADHLGCYGGRDVETPTIDALAAGGVVFDNALTPVPITLPSHATLLTGWLPHRHGVRDNGLYRLPAEPPTLAAELARAGYDTAAVVGAAVLDRQYGLDRGFRVYDDGVDGGAGLAIAERRASNVTDAALAAVAGLRPPFLLFVHYYDPHAAYRPPAPYAERFAARPYDGEIAYVDAEVGRLQRELRSRGLLGNAVVALTSDHGEGLGEHGEATHGVFLYQSTLRVPLVISAPGRWPAGRRVSGLVTTADVAPTLLQLAGQAPPAVDGRSLEPLVKGGGAWARSLPLESEFGLNSYGWAPLHGLTDGALKWIGAPEPELYDLAADAAETRNLVATRAADAARLSELWRGMLKDDRRSLPVAESDAEQATRLEKLQALGYVAGSRATPAAAGLPDPKRVIGSLESVNEARRLIGERRYDAAIARLESARRESPRNVSALVLTGVAQIQAGRPQQALAPLRRAAEIAPANADVPFNLGLACIGAGDAACAERSFRRTLALQPRYRDAAVNLIDLLLQTGRPAEAQAAFDAAHRAGLASPLLDYLEGKLAFLRGERLVARAPLERALRSGTLPPPVAADARAMLDAVGP